MIQQLEIFVKKHSFKTLRIPKTLTTTGTSKGAIKPTHSVIKPTHSPPSISRG